MNCILIEKSHSENKLVDFINAVPYFNLVSYCTSIFDAYEIIHSQKIDLIFIDTHLPKVSGIDFIKSLEKRPQVVFISSMPELAVEAFSLNAIDFLLKPVCFERFLKTANKVYHIHSLLRKNSLGESEKINTSPSANETIMVKTNYKTLMIKLNDILYIEGLKDYIKIYTSENTKPVITLNSLKKLQQNLPSERFSRVHKSYIIGLEHINAINKTQVIIHDKYIPIGESYKTTFIEKMEEMNVN